MSHFPCPGPSREGRFPSPQRGSCEKIDSTEFGQQWSLNSQLPAGKRSDFHRKTRLPSPPRGGEANRLLNFFTAPRGGGTGREGDCKLLSSPPDFSSRVRLQSDRENIHTHPAPSPLTPLPRWGEGNRCVFLSLLIIGFLSLPGLTFGQALPGTQPLEWQGDLSERMMDGAHRFVERKIGESLA